MEPTADRIRRLVDGKKRQLETLVDQGQSALQVGQAYGAFYDDLLSGLFAECLAKLPQSGPVQLAAVGSYARGTMAPRSDLDVRLLCQSEAEAEALAKALLYPLWDSGIAIGHQVVTVAGVIELAQEDERTASTLLDWRPIAGDAHLTTELRKAAFSKVFTGQALRKFVKAVDRRTATRHDRFGESVFLLEPNLKSGAGGLRDLDVIQWLGHACFGIRSITEIWLSGALVEQECARLQRARLFLLGLRNCLHLCLSARSEHLSYDRQDEVAARLGYGEGSAATEQFMRDYYRHARAISNVCDRMRARTRTRTTRDRTQIPIGSGMRMGSGTVWLEDPQVLHSEPALALLLYVKAVERGARVSQISREDIGKLTIDEAFCEKLRASPLAAQCLVRLICAATLTQLKHRSIIADLHDVGLLVAMLPEFAPVVGRAHRDAYHRFTVDVHSIAALDYIHALRRGDHAQNYRLVSQVAGDLPRVRVLCLAALFHDLGKVGGGAGHAERGAEMVQPVLRRLGIDEREIRAIAKLVLLHLKMYHLATRMDTDDPSVVSSFAFHVEDTQCLRELFLLTVADVYTTDPRSMSDWKRHVLNDLFRSTLRYLRRQRTGRGVEALAEVRKAVTQFCDGPVERRFAETLLNQMPERYLRAKAPETIAAHAHFAREAGSEVRVRLARQRGAYSELWITGPDRPGFSRLVAETLGEEKLQVLRADLQHWRANARTSRCFDLIWVKGLQRHAAPESLVARLERALRKSTASYRASPPVHELQPLASPPEAPGPAVALDNRTYADQTVVEVVTQDRQRLLVAITQVLEALDITVLSARLNTEGAQAVNVFNLVNSSNRRLDAEQARTLEAELTRVLTGRPPPRGVEPSHRLNRRPPHNEQVVR